jgi:hypothetical protein
VAEKAWVAVAPLNSGTYFRRPRGQGFGEDDTDEIKRLATKLATTDDQEVIDAAAFFVREYKATVRMVHALDGVDRMTQDDVAVVEDRLQARLGQAKSQLRSRLSGLLAWARETGRMQTERA